MPVLFHLSDLHFGPKLVEHLADLVLRDILAEKPNLVVVSGDWTLHGRVSEYEQASAFLQRLPTPVFTIPGNHDQPLHWGGLYDRLTQPWARYEKFIRPETDGVLQTPGLFVIGLNDNHRFLPGGIWSALQRRWMEKELTAAPENVCRIVVMHHQLLWDGKWRPAGQWFPTRTLNRLSVLGVDLILNGHTHVSLARLAPNGIVIAQAGTTMSTRTRHGEGNSYNRIEIEGELIGVDIRTFEVEADRFVSQRRFIFSRRRRTEE
jgi:3',5'-cyclic AMP phosphodiesterase CpdA